MKVTVKQFADAEGISTVEASAVLSHLAKRGYASKSTVKSTGRGRPAFLFTFRKVGTLDMTKTVADTAVPSDA
jgi:predicted ArsR family transcriptional regulator